MATIGVLGKSILIAGMLVTGTINTLSKRVQNDAKAKGITGTIHPFQHPWFQTAVMFAGELLCLIVFGIVQYRKHRQTQQAAFNSNNINNSTAINSVKSPHSINIEVDEIHLDPKRRRGVTSMFLFVFPTCCDILGTSFGGIGLLWVSASVWQMMRGSIIIFSGILSVIFLKRKLLPYRWVGMSITASGLGVVALSSFLTDSSSGKQAHLLVAGLLFILAGQVCNALQMVVEEKLLKDKEFPPLQVVGMEGLWGLVLMSAIILPVMYFIPGSNQGSYENSLDAFAMITQNYTLLSMIILYWVSIAGYNFCGLAVTKSLSAIHRTLIDALRTICVWSIDLFIYYVIDPEYGEAWTHYSWVQIIGFGCLLLGTLVYNGVIRLPFFNYVVPPEPEKQPLLVAPSTKAEGK